MLTSVVFLASWQTGSAAALPGCSAYVTCACVFRRKEPRYGADTPPKSSRAVRSHARFWNTEGGGRSRVLVTGHKVACDWLSRFKARPRR